MTCYVFEEILLTAAGMATQTADVSSTGSRFTVNEQMSITVGLLLEFTVADMALVQHGWTFLVLALKRHTHDLLATDNEIIKPGKYTSKVGGVKHTLEEIPGRRRPLVCEGGHAAHGR